MESSAPESILAADYKLALKLFMNKEFERSFPLIKKASDLAYNSFNKGYLEEELFVKIVVLYLTQLGIVLTPRESQGAILLKKDKQRLVAELVEERVMKELLTAFDSVQDIPLNVLYLLLLVYYTCRDLLVDHPGFVAQQFEHVYLQIDFESKLDDVYMKRLVDMYVFNVLPESEQWRKARDVIETNPYLDRTDALARLEEAEKIAKQEKKLGEQKKKERQLREEKLAEQERERLRKEREEKSLKYKSLKQIRQETEKAEKSDYESSSHDSVSLSAVQLKQKVMQVYQLTRTYLQKYSPVLAAVAILLAIILRVTSIKKISLRDKLRETLLMAMKVTYL